VRAREEEIVVTEVTRFREPARVCTAGVTADGRVVRPIPYLLADFCRKRGIRPGVILVGDWRAVVDASPPHVEDCRYTRVGVSGTASAERFREALRATLASTMAEGFGVAIRSRQKCIPESTPPQRSLLTVRVSPARFWLQPDDLASGRLKARFRDSGGTELQYVSVTDRGLFEHVANERFRVSTIRRLNRFVRSQEEVYLRLGLSRRYQAPDGRTGFWIQLNGVYTFPQSLSYIPSPEASRVPGGK